MPTLSKTELRKAGRKAVPVDRSKASQQIVDLLLATKTFHQAPQVGLFYPLNREVDLRALCQYRSCLFPKTEQGSLLFAQVESLGQMKKGPYGILEPNGEVLAQPWKSNDLLLVPGLAFDLRGGRIGSGKGYYDRFLGSLKVRPLVWAVAWQAQVHPELPQEPFDVSMDGLVTESGWQFRHRGD